jgi:hypothetical protein
MKPNMKPKSQRFPRAILLGSGTTFARLVEMVLRNASDDFLEKLEESSVWDALNELVEQERKEP